MTPPDLTSKLDINPELATTVLKTFLRDEIRKVGVEQALSLIHI